MNNLIIILIALFFATTTFAQTQKIYVKSFPQTEENSVLLDLEGDVEVKVWAEPFVRVHTTVSLDNASAAALKLLLVQGRYRLSSNTEEDGLVITSSSRKEEVEYKGQQLKETVSYTVFVPMYMAVKVVGKTGIATQDLVGDKELPTQLLAQKVAVFNENKTNREPKANR